MARTLGPVIGAVVEELELEQPTIVTSTRLAEIIANLGIATEPKIVAHRLRQGGWLLPTGVRGSWEFAPGAHAGPYGRGDPLGVLKATAAQLPGLHMALTGSTAAWALKLADRATLTPEVALPVGQRAPRTLTRVAHVTHFTPILSPTQEKGTACLRPESLLVCLADRPTKVRSWAGVLEWLPQLAPLLESELVLQELAERPAATSIRCGYLLQSLRPDIAEHFRGLVGPRIWFGPREPLRRYDGEWKINDTILPFHPANLASEA